SARQVTIADRFPPARSLGRLPAAARTWPPRRQDWLFRATSRPLTARAGSILGSAMTDQEDVRRIAVLVRLPRVTRAQFARLLREAWRWQAPRALVKDGVATARAQASVAPVTAVL